MIYNQSTVNGFDALQTNPYEKDRNDPNSPAYAGGKIAREQGVFALPHVVTFASVFSSAYRTYSWRWDESYKNSRCDAVSMRRDCFLMGILQERRLASSQLNWHVECEDNRDKRQKACATFITNIIHRMIGLPKFHYCLQDATWYGRMGAHIAYTWNKNVKRPDGIPGPKEVLVPERFYPISGDKIQYRYRMWDDGPEIEDGIPCILVHSAYGSRLPQGETVLTDRGRALLLRSPYWRERFVIHTHEPDDADFFEGEMAGGIWGVGIRSRIYWLDWIRKEWLANICDYLQRVGQGTIILYYEAGNPQSEAKAIQVGNEISTNTVVVWPRPIGTEKQGAGIEMMNPPLAGSEALVKLMEHLEAIIERYIIGQTASSRVAGGGLGNHSTESMDSTKYRIVNFDARNLADTLTHDLIPVLQKWNCPEENYRMWMTYDVDRPNVDQILNAAYKIWSMGGKVREDNLNEVAGLPMADEQDNALQNPQFAQQAAPGGMGGPQQPGAVPGAAAGEQPPQQIAPEETQKPAAQEPAFAQTAQAPQGQPAQASKETGFMGTKGMPGDHGGPRSPEISGKFGEALGTSKAKTLPAQAQVPQQPTEPPAQVPSKREDSPINAVQETSPADERDHALALRGIEHVVGSPGIAAFLLGDMRLVKKAMREEWRYPPTEHVHRLWPKIEASLKRAFKEDEAEAVKQRLAFLAGNPFDSFKELYQAAILTGMAPERKAA